MMKLWQALAAAKACQGLKGLSGADPQRHLHCLIGHPNPGGASTRQHAWTRTKWAADHVLNDTSEAPGLSLDQAWSGRPR